MSSWEQVKRSAVRVGHGNMLQNPMAAGAGRTGTYYAQAFGTPGGSSSGAPLVGQGAGPSPQTTRQRARSNVDMFPPPQVAQAQPNNISKWQTDVQASQIRGQPQVGPYIALLHWPNRRANQKYLQQWIRECIEILIHHLLSPSTREEMHQMCHSTLVRDPYVLCHTIRVER